MRCKRISALLKANDDIAVSFRTTADLKERKALQDAYTNLSNAFQECFKCEMMQASKIYSRSDAR